jgi:hypothetical protein
MIAARRGICTAERIASGAIDAFVPMAHEVGRPLDWGASRGLTRATVAQQWLKLNRSCHVVAFLDLKF